MLRLKTLGGLSIQRDDSPPAGAATQRRRLALLALLARAGDTGLSRDKLLGYLWPESEPEKARGVLAQALYALKRDLGADELFLGSADLRLNPAVLTSDVTEFCAHLAAGRTADAVALYGGPFLDGIYVSEAPEFEHWVETQRSALAHDYAAALDRLAADATARGDHRAAVAWWRKLAAADPLSARVALGLVHALVASGDRAGAERIVAAVDCGPVVSLSGAEAQVQGGIMDGLGAALYGEITVEQGRVRQENFHQYRLLTMTEAPKVEVHFLAGSDTPSGLGEPPLPPVAPAVANAIFALTRRRLRRLPLSPALMELSRG